MTSRPWLIAGENSDGHDPDKANQSTKQDDENEFLCHRMSPFALEGARLHNEL